LKFFNNNVKCSDNDLVAVTATSSKIHAFILASSIGYSVSILVL